MTKPETTQRFLSKITQTETGCWEWIASKDKNGYGWFSVKGKIWKAHRLSYILFKGLIPIGLNICHKCDNPSCVNPDHLFAGDNMINRSDSVAKKRHAFGHRHGMSKLDEDKVIQIRSLRKEGKKLNEIADIFGVDFTLIWQVVNRKIWRHVA